MIGSIMNDASDPDRMPRSREPCHGERGGCQRYRAINLNPASARPSAKWLDVERELCVGSAQNGFQVAFGVNFR